MEYGKKQRKKKGKIISSKKETNEIRRKWEKIRRRGGKIRRRGKNKKKGEKIPQTFLISNFEM